MASTASSAEQGDFAELVRAHPSRDALGALCCDVLFRQSRSGSSSPSRKLVKARARVHGVQGRGANTSAGSVVDLLVRGGGAGEASAVVGAFAAWGLGRWLASNEGPSDHELESFVGWLAQVPGYGVFEAARVLCEAEPAERLAQVLQEACIHAEERSRGEAVLLIEALARLAPGGPHLDALASVLDDPVLEACADAMQPSRSSAPAPVPRHHAHVEGVWVSASGTGPWRVLAWLTGWALLRRLGALFAWLLRWQCHARVDLDGRIVRVERWRSVLGREVYVIDESLRAEDVRAVVRVLRRPLAVTLVGAACLVAGLVGFAVGMEAALDRGSFVPVAWGLLALGVGAGCDLLLDYAARSRGGRVWLEVIAVDRPPLRVAGVHAQDAAQLARALDELR